MSTLPQTCAPDKTQIEQLVARLAHLTAREQALYSLDERERTTSTRDELSDLLRERAHLLNVKRYLQARADLSTLPAIYPADCAGFVKVRERLPASRRILPRDLPAGLERMQSGRVRAVVYLPRNQKLSLATFDATPEQVELAAEIARAGRDARDAGLDLDAIRAAALARYDELVAQEVLHGAAH